MGHPDGAHTHGGGGSGALGELAVIIVAAAAVAAVAVPLINAITSLLEVLAVIVAALAVAGSAGLVLLLRYQGRRARANTAAVVSPARAVPPRAAETLSAAQRPAIEAKRELHIHLHGVSAEDVAAIVTDASVWRKER
jgi:hypothetical protein